MLSPLGEFEESKNITCGCVTLVVCCCSVVLLVAFSAFSVLIFSTILSTFFVDLLNSNTSFALLSFLLSSDDVAMSWGLWVNGIIELVSMKSVG